MEKRVPLNMFGYWTLNKHYYYYISVGVGVNLEHYYKNNSNAQSFLQSLNDGLNEVDRKLWHDVIELQKHWIGDITGCTVQFRLVVSNCIPYINMVKLYTIQIILCL